VAELVDAHV